VIEITGVNAADETQIELIGSLDISWQDANGGITFPPAGSTTFPPAASWTFATPVLRLEVTPLVGGSISRQALVNNTYTAFLYPNSSGSVSTNPSQYSQSSYAGGTSTDGTATGQIVSGNCNTGSQPHYCNVQVTSLGQASYLLDLGALYGSARVTITAYGNDGSQLRMENAQTLVDSTGKAQDVLRRIQVRIPDHNNYDHPDNDLQNGGNICKQLGLVPISVGSNSDGCNPVP
jgi:hypothetical protein